MSQPVRKYRELLEELSGVVDGYKSRLEAVFLPLVQPESAVLTNQLLDPVEQMKRFINELNSLESLTLADQDYTNFCLLIIYGSEMSQYLLTIKNSSQVSRQHALYWREAAVKFKEFLQKKPGI